MARKSFKEEVSKKSPWLNAKKKPERVLKPAFPAVTIDVTCKEKHGEEGQYCFQTTVNSQVVKDYPSDKVWATVECPKCGTSISDWFIVED